MKDFTSQDMVREAIQITVDTIKLTDETIKILEKSSIIPKVKEARIRVAPAGVSNADFIANLRKRFFLKYFAIEDRGYLTMNDFNYRKGGLKNWR